MNRKEIAIISAILFLTVIAWVIFGVRYAKSKSTISQKELQQIVPLTPSFYKDTIKKLKGREE